MSATPIDYGAYSTVLFMDSMVALEGKSLTVQPWHEPRTDPLASRLDRTWQNVAPQVGRHEMDFAIGPNRGGSIEVHCADFRHGRVWTFEGVACIDCHSGSPFRLAVELTASNLRGKISEAAECAYTTRPATPDDLFDLGAGGYRMPIPMAAEFERAATTANKRWFDFANEEDEEDEGVEEQEDFDEDDA